MNQGRERDSLQISIDGQTASGKDSVGRYVAERQDCVFIDTGALYRAAAWKVLGSSVDPEDGDAVILLLAGSRFQYRPVSGVHKLFLDGRDIEGSLRNSTIDRTSTQLARQVSIRSWLIRLQRETISHHPRVVVTGRAIGRTILPGADLKVYLTAEVEIRVRRRLAERLALDSSVDEHTIRAELLQRDRINRERSFDPDIPSEGSVLIDTTSMSIREVGDRIISILDRGHDREQ